METTTRKAKPTDCEGLLSLEEACFQTDKINKRSLLYLLNSPTANVILLEINSLIVGSAITLRRKNSKKLRLYSFAVHPDYRAQGLADKLQTEIEKYAKKFKTTEITLEVHVENKAAQKFYARQGYLPFGHYHQYYQDGKDGLRLKKILR